MKSKLKLNWFEQGETREFLCFILLRLNAALKMNPKNLAANITRGIKFPKAAISSSQCFTFGHNFFFFFFFLVTILFAALSNYEIVDWSLFHVKFEAPNVLYSLPCIFCSDEAQEENPSPRIKIFHVKLKTCNNNNPLRAFIIHVL